MITPPTQIAQSNIGVSLGNATNPTVYALNQDDTKLAAVSASGATVLIGDAFDRDRFVRMNDAEFTELVSSVEGIGISQFFYLYEQLKDRIPSGSLGFDLIVEFDDAMNVFSQAEGLVNNLRSAIDVGVTRPEEFAALLENAKSKYQALIDRVSKLETLFKDVQPMSHAYLVANSLPLVTAIQLKFKAIFDTMVVLLDRNKDLLAQVAALQEENEALKRQVKELSIVILRLTGPPVSGFVVTPDLFTTKTMGKAWKAGDVVRITVCGSNYPTFSAAEGTSALFKLTRVNQYDWDIKTNPELVGMTTYITVMDEQTPPSTEELVFVFPPEATVPPEERQIRSSQGTNLQLWIPINGPNGEPSDPTIIADQYPSQLTAIFSGGTPPYALYKNPSNDYFRVLSWNPQSSDNCAYLTVEAVKEGANWSGLTVSDSDGKELTVAVSVRNIYVATPRDILPVLVTPEELHIGFVGGSGEVIVTRGYGSGERKLTWEGNGQNAFDVSRVVLNDDAERVTFYAKELGTYYGWFWGGPATQPRTRFRIIVGSLPS